MLHGRSPVDPSPFLTHHKVVCTSVSIAPDTLFRNHRRTVDHLVVTLLSDIVLCGFALVAVYVVKPNMQLREREDSRSTKALAVDVAGLSGISHHISACTRLDMQTTLLYQARRVEIHCKELVPCAFLFVCSISSHRWCRKADRQR